MEIFTQIYKKNLWGSKESASGTGSTLKNTEALRNELPVLLKKFKIKSMLDIPCGDFNWMKEVNLKGIDYIGADVVEEMVEANRAKFPGTKFACLDITKSILPKVDLIFARDLFGHFSNESLAKAFANIQKSGSKYLLATSFTKYATSPDIVTDGNWKPINLMIPPCLLKPIYLINENCQEGYPHYNDKCMILVDIADMFSK